MLKFLIQMTFYLQFPAVSQRFTKYFCVLLSEVTNFAGRLAVIRRFITTYSIFGILTTIFCILSLFFFLFWLVSTSLQQSLVPITEYVIIQLFPPARIPSHLQHGIRMSIRTLEAMLSHTLFVINMIQP